MGFARSYSPVLHFDDINGRPLVGGKLYTYVAGTNTPATTYMDKDGQDANTNPILLNERGECVIWINDLRSYKFVLKDSFDNTIWDADNVTIPSGEGGGGGGGGSTVIIEPTLHNGTKIADCYVDGEHFDIFAPTPLELGETSTTAYRGDRGKTAYDHSQMTSGNPHNVTKNDVGLGSVDNTSDIDKPISTAVQNALDSLVPRYSRCLKYANVSWRGVSGRGLLLSVAIGNEASFQANIRLALYWAGANSNVLQIGILSISARRGDTDGSAVSTDAEILVIKPYNSLSGSIADIEVTFDSVSNKLNVYGYHASVGYRGVRAVPIETGSWGASTDRIDSVTLYNNAEASASTAKVGSDVTVRTRALPTFNGSQVGSSSVPTYVDANGKITACTDDYLHDLKVDNPEWNNLTNSGFYEVTNSATAGTKNSPESGLKHCIVTKGVNSSNQSYITQIALGEYVYTRSKPYNSSTWSAWVNLPYSNKFTSADSGNIVGIDANGLLANTGARTSEVLKAANYNRVHVEAFRSPGTNSKITTTYDHVGMYRYNSGGPVLVPTATGDLEYRELVGGTQAIIIYGNNSWYPTEYNCEDFAVMMYGYNHDLYDVLQLSKLFPTTSCRRLTLRLTNLSSHDWYFIICHTYNNGSQADVDQTSSDAHNTSYYSGSFVPIVNQLVRAEKYYEVRVRPQKCVKVDIVMSTVYYDSTSAICAIIDTDEPYDPA